VPFGLPIGRVLSEYARRPAAGRHPAPESPFFATRTGVRIVLNTLEAHFRRVRARAGIRRPGGPRSQPRMHDLRHTFAVHRLTTWYEQGADVQTLIHQLSVYLGHAHLADTQVYLSMTPDLLRAANERFDRYAHSGGPS
jgi:integrase